MRSHLRRIAVSVALLLTAALGTGFAQQRTAPARVHRLRHHLRECLSILDLTDKQKSDIQAVVDAAVPTLQADVDALKAARQILKDALDANPPDACAIGADALAARAAREKLRSDREAVRTQIEGTLTPDQVARLEGCLAAPSADGAPDGDDADSDAGANP
jgi:Spy/CpxP family protein refolding chaperone